MIRYKLFYYVLIVGTITIIGCGDKKPHEKAEKLEESAGMSVAKSMAQDSVKGDHKAIDIEPAGRTPIGKRFALIVGVNDYDRNSNLEYCVQDVEALRERLLTSGFMPQNIVMLSDNARQGSLKPSQTNIEVELDEMLGQLDQDGKRFVSPGRLKEGDMIVLTFSGHGAHVDGKSYFCPTGAVADRPETTMVSIDRIFKRFELSPAQHKVMFIDACRNNPEAIPSGINNRSTNRRGEMVKFTKSLERSKVPGMFLIQSCRPGQMSIESRKLKHGLFSHFLLQGMEGKADTDRNGQVTILELITFIDSRMDAWQSGTQRPTITTPPNATNFNLFPSTIKPIKLKLLVKEGHRDGQLVQNALVELVYTGSDGSTEEKLAVGKTDSAGRVTLNVPWYRANTGSGSYHVAITNGPKTKRAQLERFPEVKQYTLYAPVRPPEKLIRVTLEMEGDHKLAVIPGISCGVNIVNIGGQAPAPPPNVQESFFSRLDIKALPGSVLCILAGRDEMWCFLPLPRQNDGKVLRLRPDTVCLYCNDVPCYIDVAGPLGHIEELQNAIEQAKADPDARKTLKEKEDELKAFQSRMGAALERLAKHNPKFKVLFEREKRNLTFFEAIFGLNVKGHLGVMLPITETDTEAKLRFLRGSGVDVYFSGNMESREKLGKSVAEALRAVQPKRTMLDVKALNDLDGRLDSVESLGLFLQNNEKLPDLSKFKNLKHLIVFGDTKKLECDVKPIAALPKLQSLAVLAKSVRNADSLKACQDLQFLTLPLDDPSVLRRLPRLQYVAAQFPIDTEFSFVERLPYLQTLAVTNISKQHVLTQLAKAPQLKCLALAAKKDDSKIKFEEIEKYSNVRKFQDERPNVQVVPYQGLCMGSLWIPFAAVIAALAAYFVRRRLARKALCHESK